MAPIDLSSRDLADLERSLNTTTETVGRLKHAQALYGQAEATALIKSLLRLRAPRLTVYNRAPRFESRSELTPEARVDDSERKRRLCAAKELIDPLIDGVNNQDPREFGYGSTILAAPLLR